MHADLFWDRDEVEHQKFLDNLAPIVLFTYNRLEHTRQTIEALKANVYAAESRLFIFSDAPKNAQAESAVQAVREYLHSVDGFKEIQIVQRDENWGLARNIMDGVTSIVNRYGKIIVLEDDIVTSKYFLKYMNDALEVYKDIPKVMAVSGYAYMNDCENLLDAYFLPYSGSWGWATWRRAWEGFTRKPQEVLKRYTAEDIYRFNMDGAYDYWGQVVSNVQGEKCTWAVFFYEWIFRQNGLCLYPHESMVSNIGFDGTGENCGIGKEYGKITDDKVINRYPKIVEVDGYAYAKIREKFLALKPSGLRGLWSRLKGVFK